MILVISFSVSVFPFHFKWSSLFFSYFTISILVSINCQTRTLRVGVCEWSENLSRAGKKSSDHWSSAWRVHGKRTGTHDVLWSLY